MGSGRCGRVTGCVSPEFGLDLSDFGPIFMDFQHSDTAGRVLSENVLKMCVFHEKSMKIGQNRFPTDPNLVQTSPHGVRTLRERHWMRFGGVRAGSDRFWTDFRGFSTPDTSPPSLSGVGDLAKLWGFDEKSMKVGQNRFPADPNLVQTTPNGVRTLRYCHWMRFGGVRAGYGRFWTDSSRISDP